MKTKAVMWGTVAVLALAGCGSAASVSDSPEKHISGYTEGIGDDEIYSVNVDGVKCVVLNGSSSGGVDCNWEDYNANR